MRIAFKDDIGTALSVLGRAKFRSFMTMLGIIIGAAAVILVISISQGAERSVSDQLGNVDEDSLVIMPTTPRKSGLIGGLESGQSGLLLPSDVTGLSSLTATADIAPLAHLPSQVEVNQKKYAPDVYATSASFPDLFNKSVKWGNFFNDGGLPQGVVLGAQAANDLFGEEAPLGHPLQVMDQKFVVYGVLETIPTLPFIQSIDFNKAVFVPYNLMDKLTKHTLQPSQIVIKAKADKLDELRSEATKYLAESRGGLIDFEIASHDQLAEGSNGILTVIALAVIGVAAVSLLVGGVGIMNVMFASVNERTREIGLRKALGATNHQILNQFLAEAFVVSSLGTLIGVALAVVTSLLIGVYASFSPVLDPYIILIVAAVTIISGSFFGTLPAIKAARKDPIEALRHE